MKPVVPAIVAASVCLLLGIAAWQTVFRTEEYRRIASPDGRFYAVATYHVWRSYLALNPGGGGDKPGYVTVYTHAGQPCGTAPLELVWMVGDIEWSPGHASLPNVAEWDLNRREILH